ncbi:hypothetical protein D3C76_503010 [compost metagenome]
MLVIPLRGDELDDGVLGLLQAIARFLDHQLVDLLDVGGRRVAFLAARLFARPDHTGQGRFDIQQRAGDIHQRTVARLALAARQRAHRLDLVEDDLARLAEAEHRQGVGDLLERRQQPLQFVESLALAAHEQVQAVLDPHQFLAEGADHRTHGVAIRPGQPRPFLVDHGGAGHGVFEPVLLLQRANPRRLLGSLGDVEQQVLDQFLRRRLVHAFGALLDQAFQFMVDLPQQGAHGGAVGNAAIGQTLDDCQGDRPQRP